MPSDPLTGTRRSSDNIAPITNSASAWAVAVLLRTTSTPALAQASMSMFSAPALTRPMARSTGAECKVWASKLNDGGKMIERTL